MEKKDYFVKVIEWSKNLVYIPVITLILSAFFTFIWTLREYSFILGGIASLNSEQNEAEIIGGIIGSIDLFLLGVVSLIIAASLYELYIDDSSKLKLPRALIVNDLDSLKKKLGKLIYLILVITFFKYAIVFKYENIYELTLFAIAIFFISLSLYFTNEKK